MRKTVWPVFGVALMVTGCGGPGVPQPGDQVKPAFSQNIDWEAGQKGELWVRLQATNTEGKTRGLSFSASRKNPVAVVQFYDQNQQRLSSEDVELSERCWGGQYHNLVQVPADAYSADVTVSVNIPAKDFTVAALEKKGVEIKR